MRSWRIRHHLERARAAALSGPARTPTLIAPRIADIVNALGKIYADKRVAVAQSVPRELTVACEQQDFDEMAGNLLENAFKWARSKVAVHAHHDDGRSVSIVIGDDGPGLRPDQISQISDQVNASMKVRPGLDLVCRLPVSLPNSMAENSTSPLRCRAV
jgi:signal transduction histidine kinase